MSDYWEVHFRTPDGKQRQKAIPAERRTKQDAIDMVNDTEPVDAIVKVVKA